MVITFAVTALKISLCFVIITFVELLTKYQTRHCVKGPTCHIILGAKPCSPHFAVEGTETQRVKQYAQSDMASVPQHQNLPGVSVSQICAFFTVSCLIYSPPALLWLALDQASLGDTESHRARSLPSKSPSHITLYAEMGKNTPVPNQQEFLSLLWMQQVHPCSLG